MNSNKKGGPKQGSGSGGNKQSGSGGTQGGTHEQHVEAGRQSHKNDDKNNVSRQSESGSGSKQSSSGNKQSGSGSKGGGGG